MLINENAKVTYSRLLSKWLSNIEYVTIFRKKTNMFLVPGSRKMQNVNGAIVVDNGIIPDD